MANAHSATRSGRPPGEELYVLGDLPRVCARRGPFGLCDTCLLFLALTGLAVGLALKETRYAWSLWLEWRFAPAAWWPPFWFPRSRCHGGMGTQR
jgi:hypothetical protein